MREELTISELEDQRVELLPARETLYVRGRVHIWAYNSALAFNVYSFDSNAEAAAVQTIAVG